MKYQIMKKSETITSPKQLDEIKEFIQMELLKRGFLAPITSFEEVNAKIALKTEKFQTTPVLFEKIRLENFTSTIREDKRIIHNEESIIHNVYIQINICYDHFSGGSNSCKVFSFACFLWDNSVFEKRIY